jgi:hypothetical protein
MSLSLKSLVRLLAFSALVSVFLTRLFLLLRLDNYAENFVVSDSLLDGRPHWQGFQNRVLGPLIQHAIEISGGLLGAMHSQSAAYDIYIFVALTGVVFCYALAATARFAGTAERIACFSGILLCYILTQDRRWLYPWDPLDAMVFSILYVLILKRRPLLDYWLLFVVAIANRETAMGIGLWLLIDSVDWRRDPAAANGPRRLRISAAKAASGLAMMAIGKILVDYLRTTLFKSNYDLLHSGAVLHKSAGNESALSVNFHTVMTSMFFVNILYFPVLVFIVLTLSLYAYRFANFRKIPIYDVKILTIGIALVAAFITFSLIDEIRAMNYAIPFIVHAALIGVKRTENNQSTQVISIL